MAVAAENKRIVLDRRLCVVRPGRIDVRPSPGALVFPTVGLLASACSFTVIALLLNDLPMLVLALLLVPGIIIFPLSAMGLVYSIFGTHVIVDAKKRSACFQQGLLGLGLGTVELVPFWKIDHIAIDDVSLGEAEMRALRPPVNLRAFDVVLVKVSGKRLSLGQVITPNAYDLVVEGFDRAMDTAEAVASLVDKPLRINVELEEEEPSQEEVGRAAGPS
ncbi:MAG: hypothetical protein ACE5KW_03165 [Dehalococcoidia bacterium]